MIEQIKRKIIGLINSISQNEVSPRDTNIGILFKKLKQLDEPLYEELFNKYKVVFSNWKSKQST